MALQLRFEQIKHDLQREIRIHYRPGDKFLSQREIMNRYEASLSTVERALRELVNDKVIVRIHGKGTFVSDPEPVRPPRNCKVALLLMENVSLTRFHFYPEILLRVNDGLSRLGYTFSYHYMNDFASADAVARMLTAPDGYDGALLVGVVGEELPETLHQRNYPFVVLDNECHIPGVVSVISDGEGGAFAAVEYLIAAGHRRIGFVTHGMAPSFLARYEGYCRAMVEHGLVTRREWLVKYLPIDHAEGALDALLASPERPTAVFAGNDAAACQVVRELRRRGISVPEDISVVGFDGEWAGETCDPPLTTMEVPRAEMGEAAAAGLAALLAGREVRSQRLPVKLIERKSVARNNEPREVEG